jgi:hypothetical protein
MRILLNACLPQSLRLELPGHDVATAAFMKWDTLSNGRLLAELEAAGFACLLTADSNLSYQHAVAKTKIAVFVLRAATNRRVDLLPLIPRLLPLLEQAVTGTVVELIA